MNRKNMRSQLSTEEELQGQLRQQGISDMGEVKHVHLEANGEISVVKTNSSDGSSAGKRKKTDIAACPGHSHGRRSIIRVLAVIE